MENPAALSPVFSFAGPALCALIMIAPAAVMRFGEWAPIPKWAALLWCIVAYVAYFAALAALDTRSRGSFLALVCLVATWIILTRGAKTRN